MTREKLLVLHKTLTELLNKQFIQVSNSSAAVSVLFVQKSEGELQFCVNYCDLNWITQKNHYLFHWYMRLCRTSNKLNDTSSWMS
jgi:hypothetical protein